MKKLIGLVLIIYLLSEHSASAKIVETNQTYTYEQLNQDISEIKDKFEDVVEVKSIGQSEFGREIWAARLGKGKKTIVLIGSHHGREWMTTMLLMKMLETYADAYDNQGKVGPELTQILDQVSIWFVPMLNPDGVTIQQNQLNSFPLQHQKRLVKMNGGRMNFEGWKANGKGVDLNRQYPADWDKLITNTREPYYKFFKGKKPLEAAEVKALTKFIAEINPAIAAAYHSAGREIFWSYKNGFFYLRDYLIARKISHLTGYRLANPDKEATGGGFTDWFITKYRRPALTIEISYLVGETNPPISVFKSEWKRNQYVGLKLAQAAQRIFLTE
ncbi:M14 family metallocarboxypeptidase [Neobacillus mesonae]|uniref:M14 family metallopeptidase n=1 Tax=Neobacillus mesonae TaxID=1193713 RepID=UPI00203E3286|nr:M14 family metallocarboxypeptidase [Neobacillus mesonae]MCM3567958.1 M14 family metallocarboxypeptidase [Neobacillus mesonae]